MGRLGVIGGSGFEHLPGFSAAVSALGRDRRTADAGYARRLPVLFLARHGTARHGTGHSVPPHRVNYRANIAALADASADRIIALGAVGGIGPTFGPRVLAVPAQIIDYTHGRAASLHEDGASAVVHVDFTWPYDAALRQALLAAAGRAGVAVHDGGTYGLTQGPRLETEAEVRRLQRDGCDLIGMTAVPEAVLARERGLAYATLAFVVNPTAGLTAEPITMTEIERNITQCTACIGRVLAALASEGATAAGTRSE